MLADFRPEGFGREAVAEDEGVAVCEGGAEGEEGGGGVVEGHAGVVAVCGFHADPGGHEVSCAQDLEPGDDGGFRAAGGARSKDKEGHVG